jgi:uncharacterized protein YjbI with pentapeptide repeats
VLLANADLRGASLSPADLAAAVLVGADFRGADLQGASFAAADLRKAIFAETTIVAASFLEAELGDADFHGAKLSADFTKARLFNANLRKTSFGTSVFTETALNSSDLTDSDLRGATLNGALFVDAKLTNADLRRADLRVANFARADLTGAHLEGANLTGATFIETNLREANLAGCEMSHARLVDSDVRGATIVDCNVYAVSAWGLKRDELTIQRNLKISAPSEPSLCVDDVEVAQFIYLMVHNARIRDVIDTVSRKAVLILGRFTPERKSVLDAIRDRLRLKGYVPILFDFQKPSQRDFDETVKVLAGLSRFVIVDITNPRSSPLELQATVPDYMIPFVPIIQSGEESFLMFTGLQNKYWWVLDELEYPSPEALLRELDRAVIEPALEMEQRISAERAQHRQRRRIVD